MKCITQRLRAIDDNEKALKKQTILDSAKALFAHEPESLPSVINIAKSAGLAKGTVYLYFKTKEEIFLAILSEQYQQLLSEMVKTLENAPIDSESVVLSLTSTLRNHMDTNPIFMPLASMASSVIEKNVEHTIILEFKTMLAQNLKQIGKLLHAHYPALSEEKGTRLLLHTNALIIGLWQMQNWPSTLKPLLANPEVRTIYPEFNEEIIPALQSLWLGTLKS
ncbi:transcriptional regulator [Oleiphilus messinensis]|uniref:Transcriptional regulator n=1 Tax=Oleiphilus messinensis TaxID=141451 RepID=A0A1Y0I7A0_9GAMM|nr:TetR family transcriptional regulator [Oleiphilus messinensis]ARU55273.1 transcriptional regulator [Oleiphilus messinensis]